MRCPSGVRRTDLSGALRSAAGTVSKSWGGRSGRRSFASSSTRCQATRLALWPPIRVDAAVQFSVSTTAQKASSRRRVVHFSGGGWSVRVDIRAMRAILARNLQPIGSWAPLRSRSMGGAPPRRPPDASDDQQQGQRGRHSGRPFAYFELRGRLGHGA